MERISPRQIIGVAPLSMSELDQRIIAGIGEPLRRNLILYHFIKNPEHFRTLLRTGALSTNSRTTRQTVFSLNPIGRVSQKQ
jgi:hypothetical protein